MVYLVFQPNSSVNLLLQERVKFSVGSTKKLRMLLEAYILIFSPSLSSNRVAPSNDTQALDLPSLGFLIVIFEEIGMISGLKLKEWAANGVRRTHCVFT